MRTLTLKIDGDTTGLDAKVLASFRRLAAEAEKFNQRMRQGYGQFENFGGKSQTSTTQGRRASSVDSELRKAQADIRRYQQEQIRAEKQLTAQIEREAKQQNQARTREMKRSADNFIRELKRIEAEERRAAQSRGSFGNDLKNSFLGSLAGNVAAQAVGQLVGFVKEGAAAWLDYASKIEQARIGFTTMSGSAQIAEQHLKELQTFAARTPFQFSELVEASQKMQGVGFAASDVIPILKDVGNALSAAGRIGDLPFAIKALGDIKAKGKLAGQEIIQLANAGIPIRDVLAKSLNKSTAEIVEMGEKGQISADIVFAALHKMSEERFGGAMEAQSRTFLGALSNIKDSLLITANTAFQPLYERISTLAVRFSDDIQKQGNDFNAVGNVIAQYIGEGIGAGLSAVVEGLGGYIGRRLNEIFTEGKIIDPLTKNLFGGFFQQLGESLGVLDKQSPLKNINNNIQDISTSVKTVPSLADQLKASKAQADTDALNKVIKDLTGEIENFGNSSKEAATKQKLVNAGVTDFSSALAKTAIGLARHLDQLEASKKQFDAIEGTLYGLITQVTYFGDESEVAATKQQLLSQGVTNLNSGLAQQALAWAARLDQLKAAKEEQDKYTDKLKSFGEELKNIRDDADFKLRFTDPTELDEFNEKVRKSGLEFSSLHKEIERTRQSLRDLAFDKAVRERGDAINSFSGEVKNLIESFNEVDKLDFKSTLVKIVEPLGLDKAIGGGATTPEQFADRIEGIIADWRTELDAAENAGRGITDINNKNREIFQNYLDSFKKDTGEGNRAIKIFGESEADGGNIENLLQLSNALIEARKKLAENSFSNVTSELDDEIQKLNEELGLSAELSRADTIAKELQKEAYKDLSVEQRQLIVSKAQEIDQLKAAQKAQEEYRRAFERTTDIFEDALLQLSEGNWKGFFQSILDEMRRFLTRAAAEWLASKFFKLVSNQGAGGGGSSGGGIFSSLKQIFSGGGMGGGGFSNGTFSNGTFGGTPQTFPNRFTGGETFTPSGAVPTGGGFPSFINFGGGGSPISAAGAHEAGHISGGSGKLGLSGGLALAGMGANILGGLIGGRVGGVISMAGTGLSLGATIGSIIPGIGTAIGAAIGAIGGGILGLFMGDPKRKVDKKENMPKLQQGFKDAFKEFSDLIADVNALRVDPDSAMGRGRELRAAIASGFGIEFQSKKYKKQSQQLITQQLAAIDAAPGGLMEQLKHAVEVAKAAGERTRRILPEFADGGAVSQFFRDNFTGLVPGIYDRRDDKLIKVSGNEVVLTPNQWMPITPYLASARVPGFADGGSLGSARIAAPVFAPNITIVVEGEIDAARIKSVAIEGMGSEHGQRVTMNNIKVLRKNKEI